LEIVHIVVVCRKEIIHIHRNELLPEHRLSID
jgi:hypothetical protein